MVSQAAGAAATAAPPSLKVVEAMSNELLQVMKEQIQFEPNQAKFTPKGLEVLNKVAAVLQKTDYKSLKVIVEGHAKCPGDCKDPVCGLSQLAKLRTEAVIKALKVGLDLRMWMKTRPEYEIPGLCRRKAVSTNLMPRGGAVGTPPLAPKWL